MLSHDAEETPGPEPYPFGPAERLDLHPRYEMLRERHPVLKVRMPYGGTAWLVTRHREARIVLADPRFSKATAPDRKPPRSATVTPLSEGTSILGMDPPEHTRLRRIVTKAFTARRITDLRPRTRAIADGLLDRMIAAGQTGDLADAYVWPLPIRVICELLGVPPSDQALFRTWTEQLLTLDDATVIERARANLQDYLAEQIARRRSDTTDDLLGTLVAARDERDQLSEQELITFGVALLVAGHETTSNQLGNCLFTLLSERPLWLSLVEDRGLVASAVEELLRFLPLVTSAGGARYAREDIELGEVIIPAGDAVIVQADAANRDASVFSRADEIDFRRAHNPHLSFGYGPHHCLGAQLARMEMQVATSVILERLPQLRLAVPADEIRWRSNHIFRGVGSLPVRW
jgi:cytochrome P450